MKALFKTIIALLMLGIIVSACFVVSFCVFKYADHDTNPHMTITAHTGCEGSKANTVQSMEAGYNAGADIIEFDLNFDGDKPVLAHTKVKGGETTFEDACKFLAEHPTLKANIDVKKTDNMPAVMALITTYGLNLRVFFTGVKEEFVEAVKTGCPGIAYYYNCYPNLLKINNQKYLDELVQTVKDKGAIGINMHQLFISKKLVKTFHDNGLLVSIWTINDSYFATRALYYAPDNITTKRPAMLKNMVG